VDVLLYHTQILSLATWKLIIVCIVEIGKPNWKGLCDTENKRKKEEYLAKTHYAKLSLQNVLLWLLAI